MKAASTREIKDELKSLPPAEVLALCLRLVRFKKENKELLSYLLFNAHDPQGFVDAIQHDMDEAFAAVPRNSRYLAKKSLRAILRNIARFSRYTATKEAEVQLRLHFCRSMKAAGLAVHSQQALFKLYVTQVNKVQSLVPDLHEDLQFEYQKRLNELGEV